MPIEFRTATTIAQNLALMFICQRSVALAATSVSILIRSSCICFQSKFNYALMILNAGSSVTNPILNVNRSDGNMTVQ